MSLNVIADERPVRLAYRTKPGSVEHRLGLICGKPGQQQIRHQGGLLAIGLGVDKGWQEQAGRGWEISIAIARQRRLQRHHASAYEVAGQLARDGAHAGLDGRIKTEPHVDQAAVTFEAVGLELCHPGEFFLGLQVIFGDGPDVRSGYACIRSVACQAFDKTIVHSWLQHPGCPRVDFELQVRPPIAIDCKSTSEDAVGRHDEAKLLGLDQGLGVGVAVGNQANRRIRVERGGFATRVTKVRAPLDEQRRVCPAPHRLVEHGGLCSSRDQRDPVAMVRQAAKPLHGFAAERGVAPNSSCPFLRQPIVFDRETALSCQPRGKHRCAGIQVKRAKLTENRKRRQPFVSPAHRALVP